MTRWLLVLAALTLAPMPARAQIGSWFFTGGGSPIGLYPGTPGAGGWASPSSTTVAPPVASAAPDTRYVTSPETRQRSEAALVAQLRRTDPTAADQLGAVMAREDFGRRFDMAAAPLGLRRDDAADVMAAYFVRGWSIVHGGEKPTPAQAQGVRRQVLPSFAKPALAEPGNRSRLAEATVTQVVLLDAGWQAARAAGTQAAFATDVGRRFQREGLDLAQMALTERGFEARH